MPKPDPARLDPSRYPFQTSIEPRFGDLDVNMHVNNVALMGMCEEARIRFHRASGYNTIRPGTSMIVSFAIEFLGQTFYPGTLEFHAALSHMGRTSHTVDLLVTQGDRTVAWTRAVIVDVRDDAPIAMSEAYVARAGDWMFRA